MSYNINKQAPLPTFLRWPQVAQIVGLSRSRVHALVAEGKFPKPIKLGTRASAWIESEVHAWIKSRINDSRLTPKQHSKQPSQFET
jgi:predicted DNA-binding transcriptional regulator AlpA